MTDTASGFFDALTQALDTSAVIDGVDPDKMLELGSALLDAGWSVGAPDDRTFVQLIHPDGRSFTMRSAA